MAGRAGSGGPSVLGSLLLGLGCLLGGLVLVGWQWRWVRSVLAGPVPISQAELKDLADPGKLPNPWVTFKMDKVQDTGLGIASKKGSVETQKSQYLLAEVEGRVLIVEVAANHSGNEVTGYLDVWGTPLRKKAVAQIEGKFPQLKARMLPYQMDCEYGYRGQCYAMLGIAGFLVLCGLLVLATNVPAFLRGQG